MDQHLLRYAAWIACEERYICESLFGSYRIIVLYIGAPCSYSVLYLGFPFLKNPTWIFFFFPENFCFV